MLLLGIDIGTSSVKVSVVDAITQKALVTVQVPDTESPIKSLNAGWAEQSPEMWWSQTQEAIQRAHKEGNYDPVDITAIGVAYQMHGLVLVDKDQELIRDSIIWCDSRAVELGNKAFETLGESYCLHHLLNSPGNFTASKLAWVKENEPELYSRIDKVMLPGDYIAMKLTGEVTTSVSALSEGIFYDFLKDEISKDVTAFFGFERNLFPKIQSVFSNHGELRSKVAATLGLKPQVIVTYKAGDQPNNALSLNVMRPGEVAATAGTSGVIYGISDELTYDKQSRINSFAHVNYEPQHKNTGVLLCINGTGSLNRWAKNLLASSVGYEQMNMLAKGIPEGSNGLRILPFGNGAERMLNNKLVGVHFHNIDLNLHTSGHIFRAVQEGIACAFKYGLDIMRENGMTPTIIRAGKANLFISEVFTQSFVNVTGVPVELYLNDGSVGAALGAGIGSEIYNSVEDAFTNAKVIALIEPRNNTMNEVYEEWYSLLSRQMEIV